jgi:SSS family solute:Na+ symporter
VSVTLYSLTGGIVAVIYTDAVQTVVLVAGAVVCAALMVGSLPGGPGQMLRVAAEQGKFGLGGYGAGFGEPTVWVVLLYGLTINLQNFGIDQNYVQRYIASKSDAEARKSVWIGGLMYVPLSAVFLFIGTAMYAYYAAYPGSLPAAYRGAARADFVFPWFIVSVLPPGVTGLLIAAIFAAAMSTVSTCLNSSATVILSDYYQRFINPQTGERQSMMILRATTVFWGAAGTGAALAMTRAQGALDAWWTLAGIFGGGMLGLFLLGFFSRRVGNRAAQAGVGTGVLLILWMTLSPRSVAWPAAWRSPFHDFLTIVFGTLAVLVVGLAIGHAESRSK